MTSMSVIRAMERAGLIDFNYDFSQSHVLCGNRNSAKDPRLTNPFSYLPMDMAVRVYQQQSRDVSYDYIPRNERKENRLEEEIRLSMQQSTYTTTPTTQTTPRQRTNNSYNPQDYEYNIAVIDFCDESSTSNKVDLDGDNIGDMVHGNVVANLIDSVLGDKALITCYDITGDDSKIISSLKSILSDIQSGKCKYDAVNMSLSQRITYSDLSKILGVKITNDNISQYQTQIRNWLKQEVQDDGDYALAGQAVSLIEQIEAAGCDVYISAANCTDGTDDEINLFTLAQNSSSVGALDTDNKVASFSFNNSLIDDWMLGEVEVHKIYNGSSFSGFDLNGDGKVDIDGSYGSDKGKNKKNGWILGTSFSSPLQLIYDLQKA